MKGKAMVFLEEDVSWVAVPTTFGCVATNMQGSFGGSYGATSGEARATRKN